MLDEEDHEPVEEQDGLYVIESITGNEFVNAEDQRVKLRELRGIGKGRFVIMNPERTRQYRICVHPTPVKQEDEILAADHLIPRHCVPSKASKDVYVKHFGLSFWDPNAAGTSWVPTFFKPMDYLIGNLWRYYNSTYKANLAFEDENGDYCTLLLYKGKVDIDGQPGSLFYEILDRHEASREPSWACTVAFLDSHLTQNNIKYQYSVDKAGFKTEHYIGEAVAWGKKISKNPLGRSPKKRSKLVITSLSPRRSPIQSGDETEDLDPGATSDPGADPGADPSADPGADDNHGADADDDPNEDDPDDDSDDKHAYKRSRKHNQSEEGEEDDSDDDSDDKRTYKRLRKHNQSEEGEEDDSDDSLLETPGE